jgi:hypothetical protein
MSENTVNKILAEMGYKNKPVAHGFRALASTILNESNLFNKDAIERQLAHMERNQVRAAYNRAQYMDERRKMMQWWADYLTTAATKKTVNVPKMSQKAREVANIYSSLSSARSTPSW